ncbi:hypothetical protein OIU84_028438 [Salix udensis]|uniref:NOT transcription complex subunit VIP2 n=1 Tax=Salix udensis TaxID=889485 RepID=A0AAD6P8K9_9ROSI|nr:hypothetical protein OIU84_028438 [Salix udensis]
MLCFDCIIPQSSLNGSTSNLPDTTGRSFPASFSSQSGAASPVFHHSGTFQGLHNIHGSFNVPSMPGTLASRNSTVNNSHSVGIQQPTGSLSGGRFASNNLPVGLTQLSQGSSHGHSGVTNRGGISVVGNPGYGSNTNGIAGSIPGILPASAGIGNRNAVSGLGVSQFLGNAGPRITSPGGTMVAGGNIGRSLSTGGGLSVPGLASRLNLTANSGSGSLSVQGQNRLMGGGLPQGNPQVIPMLGNSYPTAVGPLSHSHVPGVNNLSSIGMLNDVNSNDISPFDINNDFPQMTSHPSSAGGPQGQLGSLRKPGIGVSPIGQQSQEFSIQNEDFPALPGFKGSKLIQTSGPPGLGLRPLNSPNTVSSVGSYDQLIQQYQHPGQSQLRLQQMSAVNQPFRDQSIKSMQAAQSMPDPFGLLGLLNVIRMNDPDLTSLALGIDLTTLGLNLNSTENLHKTFGSPWSEEPAKGDPEFNVPKCYMLSHDLHWM